MEISLRVRKILGLFHSRAITFFRLGSINYKSLAFRNKFRKKVENENFTIIANNCIAGTIYKDLGIPYCTPFVGLYLLPGDFIKVCGNLDYYLSLELQEVSSHTCNFPVGQIADVLIYFMHYDSFEIAKTSWERRAKRISKDLRYFILVERDGCSYADLVNFDGLDLSNKVTLTYRHYPEFRSAFQLSYFKNRDEVGDVLQFKNSFSGKRIMYDFKFSDWLKTK